jgi:glyoxylate reductase
VGRVVVTRRLLPGALEPLAGHDVVHHDSHEPLTTEELAAAAASSDALVCQLTDRIDRALLARADHLTVVANVAVGYDNIDVPAATEAGVLVCNTPGVLDETTADLAFALILAACRDLSSAERSLRTGAWDGFRFDRYLGVDVHGATLGIVGYGRIGRAVARRARGFGMTVVHCTRTTTGEPGCLPIDDLLRTADIVSLHVPLSDATRHLIGRRELALMKPTAVLVNTARGPVVDEDALADALDAGQIFAAGLDVYDGEPNVNPRLLASPRTVLAPHIGSATFATRLAMARLACDSAARALNGELPATAINPEVWPTR